MWLTGFDAPSLHTLYIDKPMRDHGLLQAIARMNRVSRTSLAGSSSTTSASATPTRLKNPAYAVVPRRRRTAVTA
jgi:hypothetical protein